MHRHSILDLLLQLVVFLLQRLELCILLRQLLVRTLQLLEEGALLRTGLRGSQGRILLVPVTTMPVVLLNALWSHGTLF